MPEFLTHALENPAEPVFGIAISVLLWLIFRSLEEIKSSLVSNAAANTALSNTLTGIVTALEGVADNVERGTEIETELVRMQERTTTAQTERHQSNLNLMNMILTRLDNHRGRT